MLPLSLRPSSVRALLRVVLRVGSARPLLCEGVSVPLADAAAALGAYARRGEARRAFDGCYMYHALALSRSPTLKETAHP